MEYTIKTFEETHFVGFNARMSLMNNSTPELWRKFMPLLPKIPQRKNENLYAIQVYDDLSYFENFNPNKAFEMWAAIAVESYENIKDEFHKLTLQQGLYAIFIHRGKPDLMPKTMQYILGTWLPSSSYLLDNRPHFQVMNKAYSAADSSAEEEIWIPVLEK